MEFKSDYNKSFEYGTLFSMIDSHCHLDFQVFDQNRDQIIEECFALGVEGILVPSTTKESFTRVLDLAQSHSLIRSALGLHPYFLDEGFTDGIRELEHQLNECRVVAVGEIGLDIWPGSCNIKIQLAAFEQQLAIASQMQLPVVLHARKSEDLLFSVIKKTGFKFGGIVHAFNGSLVQAKRFIDLGFVLGIGGTISYERAKKARRVLIALPENAFVLETDAPDMPLSGFQGQPNTPHRVLDVANYVSELRGQSIEDIVRYTSSNVKRVLPNW